MIRVTGADLGRVIALAEYEGGRRIYLVGLTGPSIKNYLFDPQVPERSALLRRFEILDEEARVVRPEVFA